MRTALPWILLALVTGGWIGKTVFREQEASTVEYVPAEVIDAEATAADVEQLKTIVAVLRTELETLREQQKSTGPALATSGKAPTPRTAPRAPPRSAGFTSREAEVRQARAERAAAEKQRKAMWDQRKTWLDAVRSLKDAGARETALAEMRAAFDGTDAARKLAALQLARWIGNVKYDRADWRGAILPHARAEDPDVRLAALTALAYVRPERSDLALWTEAVKSADRNNAEEIAQALVRTAEGVIRGETADAVLHLLRDGTKIKKAFVIRGLQSAKEWDPSVEARLIEVVRAVPAHDYDSAYYFHFITPRLDPKSDAVLDLMLEKIAGGKSSIETIVRGFRVGLDDRQKDATADKLLELAENAGTAHAVRQIAQGLGYVARAQDIPRMEALVSGEGVDKYAKSAMDRAIESARSRR